MAFNAFVNLFENWKMQEWYKGDLYGLREEVFVAFPAMMQKHLKKTKTHLVRLPLVLHSALTAQDSMHIAPSLFITQWCLELFFSSVPFELVLRIWDLYLLLGPTAFYGVSLALLKLNDRAPSTH